MAHPLVHENIWFDKWRYDDAEVAYQMGIAAGRSQGGSSESSIVSEIARAREQIHKSLQMDGNNKAFDASDKLQSLSKENAALRKVTDDLWSHVKKLEARVDALEKKAGGGAPAASTPAPTPAAPKPAPAAPAAAPAEEKDDDDFELFGDDDEEEDSEEKKRLTEERLKAYEAKKAGKTAIIAKSCVILDVKPWDDETDMKAMEQHVRSIEMDGLVWGASKLVPLAYGIQKLQISSVVEDDKVSVDELQEKIEGFEDLVQSVDIAAFNKL